MLVIFGKDSEFRSVLPFFQLLENLCVLVIEMFEIILE